MSNLINQIRNEQRPALNQAIESTKQLMRLYKNARDPQSFILQLTKSNPIIANALQNNMNLESLAREIANNNGIDINQLLKQLQI